jgi:hypothetical protein
MTKPENDVPATTIGETRMLFMYTGVIGVSIPDNIAVSVTYCCKRKVTAAVIYGCTHKQKEHVQRLLENCEGSKNHPYLVVGTFAELQFDALSAYVAGITNEWDQFECDRLNRTDCSDSRIKRLNAELRNHRVRIKEAEGEVRLTKRHLKSTIDHLESLLPNAAEHGANGPGSQWQQWQKEMEEVTTRFKKRFLELDGRYDDMIVRCETTAEGMKYSAQQVRGILQI